MTKSTLLSERDIEIGFWRFGLADESNFSPVDTYEIPDDIFERERLSLDLSTLSLAENKQRKVLQKEWHQLLPKLSKLKYLWLSEKINQKLFDEICNIKSLEGLWIKWTSIEQLENIVNLENLKHIFIGSSTKMKNLEPLSRLKKIATIHTDGLPLISDFSCLTNLHDLEGLKIEGTMWKSQRIDTLDGFEKFRNLKYLNFINVVVADKNSKPITNIKTLINLTMHYRWTRQDYEQLYSSLPNLKYGDVKSVVEKGTFKEYLSKRL